MSLTFANPLFGAMVSPCMISADVRPFRVRVADIQRVVSTFYDIPETEMKSQRRSRIVARPRQVAMYLAREYTPRSLPEIGSMFGDRDHTTIMHGIRKVRELCVEFPEFADEVRMLRRIVEGVRQ